MADPFTLATGIAGIISLALQLATTANDFASYTKDAISGPKRLFEELKALSAVLEQLQNLLTTQASSLTFSKTSVLYMANDGCRARLKRLLEKLQQHSKADADGKPVGKVFYTLHRMKWPLQVKETREAAEDIHRYAQVFMFALTVEGCDLLTRTFSTLSECQSRLYHGVNDVLDAVRALPDYKEGLDRLGGHVNNLELLSKEQTRRNEQRQDFKIRKELLDKISSSSPHQRHYDAKSKYEDGTCQWFIEDNRFKWWERGEGGTILWGFGVPGAGKTVLTSFVIDHLKGTLKHPHVAYLYGDYKDQNQWSAPGLLSSITRQLAETDQNIFAKVSEFWDDSAKKYFNRSTFDLRWNVAVLQHIGKVVPDLFIIIDALDEIPDHTEHGDEIRREFADSLRKLPDTYRIFVTSRSHLGVETLLGNCAKLEISPPKSDIKALVRSKFSTSTRLSHLLGQDECLKEKFADALIDRSSGMFLMARFQLDQISSVVTVRQIYSVLEKPPSGLYGFYDEQIRRLSCLPYYEKALCIRVLSWVFGCKRPLLARELVTGLAVEAGDTNIDSSGIMDIGLILELCAGLIHLAGPHKTASGHCLPHTIQKKITGKEQVRFVHSTVQDYLADYSREIFGMHPDLDIFRACSTYLALAEIQEFTGDTDSLRMKYPFLSYAVNFWPAHVSVTMNDGDHAAMGRIMKPHADQAESLTLSASEPSEKFNPLWLLWTNSDISESSSKLRRWSSSTNWQHLLSSCPSIISLAALLHHQNEYAFRWLVHNAWDPFALQVAVADGMPILETLLDRLTEAGVRLDQYDHTKDFVYPPILEAINMSNRSLVRQLLDSSHDPNFPWKPCTYHGTQAHLLTPLEAAVQRSWKPVIQMLVQAGADPNLPGGKFGTAMQIAKRKGEVDIMRILAEASDDIDDWEIVNNGTSGRVGGGDHAYKTKCGSIAWKIDAVRVSAMQKLLWKGSSTLSQLYTRRG